MPGGHWQRSGLLSGGSASTTLADHLGTRTQSIHDLVSTRLLSPATHRTWQLDLHWRVPITFVSEAEPPEGSPAPDEDAPLCRQRQRVRATARRLHHPAEAAGDKAQLRRSCRLCCRPRVLICKSHYIHSWFYNHAVEIPSPESADSCFSAAMARGCTYGWPCP